MYEKRKYDEIEYVNALKRKVAHYEILIIALVIQGIDADWLVLWNLNVFVLSLFANIHLFLNVIAMCVREKYKYLRLIFFVLQ